MGEPRTLIISNDFPPSVGGIEAFVETVAHLLDDEVVVITRDHPGAGAYDRRLGFPVHRMGRVLLPSPAVAGRARQLVRALGIHRVLFGAAAPLGLLAGSLRAAGVTRQVALTHGHETWWAQVPGARSLLRRIGEQVDHLTTVSAFTEGRITPALTPAARARVRRLAPPLAPEFCAPSTGADPLLPTGCAAGAPSLPAPPTVVAAGRMVRQKGFDTLLYAWRQVLDGWSGPARASHASAAAERPGPVLRLIGDGPQRAGLGRLAERLRLGESVQFTGALSHEQLAAELRGAELFALPVRTRFGGLNPEGLGLVFLEAQACGLPVLVGDSGGAPETVVAGRVLDPEDPAQWSAAILELLGDPVVTRALGERARRGVLAQHDPQHARAVLRELLALDEPDAEPRDCPLE